MSLRSPALVSVGVANLVDRVMCAQGPPRFSRGLCCPHRKPKSLDSIVRQSLGSCLESQQGLWPLMAGCWPASFLLPRHGGKVLSMSCVRCKPCPGRRQHSPIGYTALLEWAGSLRNLVLEGRKLSYSAYVFCIFSIYLRIWLHQILAMACGPSVVAYGLSSYRV